MNLSRQKIINESIDLFAEKNVGAVSAAKMAKRAGMSVNGVRYHFNNGKEGNITATLNMPKACVKQNMYDAKGRDEKNADSLFCLVSQIRILTVSMPDLCIEIAPLNFPLLSVYSVQVVCYYIPT